MITPLWLESTDGNEVHSEMVIIGLQEPEEEVHIPFETHSEVNEGMSVF